jgi:predicted GNAT family acetyltransferase
LNSSRYEQVEQLALADYEPLEAQELRNAHQDEVLSFLAARPVHTVYMAGLIHDNGIESSLNRGKFYGCRNAAGRLKGVALVGHATLMETDSPEAIRIFATIARSVESVHMIMGEQQKVEEFWQEYAAEDQSYRLACRELLFEKTAPVSVHDLPEGLRLATAADLELIAPVHAAIAFAESQIDPLAVDRDGFLARTLRRIEQRRVWVVINENKLLFKADIQSESHQVAYLEGIYVAPEMRGKGLALSCLSELTRNLLSKVNVVCLLANETNVVAHSLYRRAGFKLSSTYDTVFL